METEIKMAVISFLVYGLLCLLVTVAYIVAIVKIVKMVKRRAEANRIAKIEEERRRREAEAHRKKVEAERRKAEEERKEAEEKAKKEEEARQVKQWTETYKKSSYAKNLAKMFANEFINAISRIIYDVHQKKVDVCIERNAYYTIFRGRFDRGGYVFDPVVDGLDFYKENLEEFNNEFQLQGFMEAVLDVAEEIVKREYAAKHPFDVNGQKYQIWKSGGYPIGRWDSCEGEYNEQDRKDGIGKWNYRYSVSLCYSAPNPYYEPPKSLI